MDFFAITSIGTYPIPTPTALQRAAYAVSYGLLGLLPTPSVPTGKISEGLGRLTMGMKLT